MDTRRLVSALCLATALELFVSAPTAVADPDPSPPSWSSFVAAEFLGVDLVPSLTTDQLIYDLHLRSGATIYIGSNVYTIKWIQAFFVVSQDQETSFVATNGSGPAGWKWEEKSLPGRIAGWHNEGTGRIYPEPRSPSSAHFEFGSFDITGNAVLPGYHLGYQDGASEVTGWFKGPTVPEPSSLFGLGAAFLTSLALLRRRWHAR
jgi:hypothetical protein